MRGELPPRRSTARFVPSYATTVGILIGIIIAVTIIMPGVQGLTEPEQQIAAGAVTVVVLCAVFVLVALFRRGE
jgi:hypothetical protein